LLPSQHLTLDFQEFTKGVVLTDQLSERYGITVSAFKEKGETGENGTEGQAMIL